jgi:hypothetical protein
MAAGGSSSSAQPEKLMKGLQLDKKSLNSSQEVGNGRMEIDMRNEASVLNFTCALDICSHIILSLSLFNALKHKQKYESYRFEGDPNEVGHVVTTRCTTREDASDVR